MDLGKKRTHFREFCDIFTLEKWPEVRRYFSKVESFYISWSALTVRMRKNGRDAGLR